MRVLFIAAVLGTLAHPAWAIPFSNSDCSSLAFGALGSVEASRTRLAEAIDMLHKDPNTRSQRYYDLLDESDKKMELASNMANVYQAFCKD